MVDFSPYVFRSHPPYLPEDVREIGAFLEARGLRWEDDADFTVACLLRGRLMATGSLAGRIIKCLAVEESLQGEGLAATIVSRLEAEAGSRGIASPFVFTPPRNVSLFRSMGYHPIAEADSVVALLEKGDGIQRWIQTLRDVAGRMTGAGEDPPAALVMNCNPLTRGHLHLIRTAAESAPRVFLFVVSEEASAFPADVRLRLVQEETAAMPSVTVVPGSDYLVSRATFPSYFLKGDACSLAATHARLDAGIFAEHVAPALGVRLRCVGEEPYCTVTAAYNRVLKEVLPLRGIAVREIPRLRLDGEPVSASQVRKRLREGDLAGALRLVPGSTARYLASKEAAPVLARLAASEGRH